MVPEEKEIFKRPLTVENMSSYFKRKVSGRFCDEADSLLNCKITMLDIQQVFPVKKQDHRKHIHGEYEIILPRRVYHCQLNGAEITVSHGELLLVQPGDVHKDHLDPAEPYDSFRFFCRISDLLPQQNILKKEIFPAQQKTPIKKFSSVQYLCDLIWEEIKEGSALGFPVANGIFQGLFWKFLTSFDKQTVNENLIKKSKMEADVQKFLEVLHRHLNDFPDIPRLCREMGMSRSTLSRLSQENFSCPPLRMLMFYKMKYARECLDCIPDITIKELSGKLGFSDQCHFSKVYKRFFKTAPTVYVKKRRYQ